MIIKKQCFNKIFLKKCASNLKKNYKNLQNYIIQVSIFFCVKTKQKIRNFYFGKFYLWLITFHNPDNSLKMTVFDKTVVEIRCLIVS